MEVKLVRKRIYYTKTVSFFNSELQKTGNDVIQIVRFVDDVMPGLYKLRNSKWHVYRDGLWIPIGYSISKK